MTALFYYSFIESGYVTLGLAMGIPLLLTGIGMYADAELREED